MTNANSWRPRATLRQLEMRATMLATARAYFSDTGALEVETPAIVGHAVTDPHIESVRLMVNGHRMWLRTSPEYHMKRLLAAHARDIFQIGKAFRAGEAGRYHQPEFTMIEWYRIGYGMREMIEDTCVLILQLAACAAAEVNDYKIQSYADVFLQSCNLDPVTATLADIRETAKREIPDQVDPQLETSMGEDRGGWLDLLATHVVVPSLPANTLRVITDYPAEQAMLARRSPDNPAVAERFEVFLNGVELANGFCELRDAEEQAERFAADNARRHTLHREIHQPDTQLLAALADGLPQCAGVAVGLDRLLMLTTGERSVSDALSFAPGH